MSERRGPHAMHPVRPLLCRLLGGSRRALVLGAALAVLTVCMGIGLLGLSGWFITATALAGLQVATAIVFDVFMPSAGIRLLALGRTLSRYGERLITHEATLGVLARLREQIFRGWAGPQAARQLRLRPARLLFRLTADIDALEALYVRLLVPALATLGAALLAGVIVAAYAPWLGLALSGWLLLAGWGTAGWLAAHARRPAVRRAIGIEVLRARAADLAAGQTELALAGRLPAQQHWLASADARIAAADAALNRLEARAGLVQGLTGAVTLSGSLLAMGWLADAGRMDAPAAALLVLAALASSEPFAALRRGALDAGRTLLAARRLAPALVPAASASGPVPPGAGEAICLSRVVVRHGDRLALEVPALRIRPGERVALIGPSGAGKSTLLALLAGEMQASQGVVQAQTAAWLTQRTELFQDDLRGNLRIADPQAGDETLFAVLSAAGLAGDVACMPDGLGTRLGEGGLGLSGGQARRLAMARLLLQARPLWLLDEPTESLDNATAQDVLRRLRARSAGHTLLVATHLRREAALADRLLRIEHGCIVHDLPRGSAGFDAALAMLRPD